MTHITGNRVSEFTQSLGTGPLELSAAPGYKRFRSVMGVGDTCWYLIEWLSPTTGEVLAFEHGTATYTAPDTLTRTAVKESSSGLGTLHAFPAGKKKVSIPILMPDLDTAVAWRGMLGVTTADVAQGSAQVADAVAYLNSAASSIRAQTTFLGAA